MHPWAEKAQRVIDNATFLELPDGIEAQMKLFVEADTEPYAPNKGLIETWVGRLNHKNRKHLEDFLGLVYQDWPDMGLIQRTLRHYEIQQVIDWATACHGEAAMEPGSVENEVGPCPEALRDLLPDDHFYKNWRV